MFFCRSNEMNEKIKDAFRYQIYAASTFCKKERTFSKIDLDKIFRNMFDVKNETVVPGLCKKLKENCKLGEEKLCSIPESSLDQVGDDVCSFVNSHQKDLSLKSRRQTEVKHNVREAQIDITFNIRGQHHV